MNGYESENDICTYFFEFEHLRDKLCATLDDERDKIDQLIMHTKASDPRANCSVLGLSSKLHLMNSFKESLNVLAARFARTTDQKNGKEAFVEDIQQISSDMQIILDYGWAGCEQIMYFPRFDENDHDASGAAGSSELVHPHATPRNARHARALRKRK